MKEIAKEVYEVLQTLNNHEYEAYLVGGAVRSLLLKEDITDYDVTTSASPEMIKQLFSNYPLYLIGEKHGTVVVTINNVKIDITTFRKESNYLKHRFPSSVTYSDSLLEDLKRRDFTINALCLDQNDKLYDYFKGVDDLNNKLIRAIGDPDTRFNEDALRILRAIRFKTRLNFEIEEETEKAVFKNKDLLKDISMERKKDELLQILSYKNKQENINKYLEIFRTFIPINEIDETINNFSNNFYSLAYLLSKTNGYNLKTLKFSKQEINLLEALIEATNTNLEKDYDFISLLSDPHEKDILNYLKELHGYDYQERYKKLEAYIITRSDLAITSEELINMGYKDKNIKLIQDELLDKIRHQELENTHTALINYLKLK